MQSHTFTRARGVTVLTNGSASSHAIYQPHADNPRNNPPNQYPSTSRSIPRSESLAPRNRRKQHQDSSLPPTYVPRFHDEAAVRRMTYRRLTSTDMIVSKIAFGSAPIGGMFGNIEDSITAIVEKALKSGVNLIDTGYWYGQSRSESILGKILSGIPRRSYYICSKVGRFELDYARTFDFRADKILESLTNSLKRLKHTYLDICFVQIHDADFTPNQSIILYETLQALEMARHSGKIRYIGITGYPLRKIVNIVECSPVKIDVVMSYCHGTLNDNSLGEYTSFFQNKGVGLLNASPLSMGLLTERGPPPWHPAGDFIKETALAATHYCMSKNISISKLALEYALNIPGCTSCVISCDSVQQINDILELCCSNGLTQLELRVRDRIMRRYFDRLENAGWEELDVTQYWRKLKKLGLSALATHRHSSVESLASTLNGISLSVFSSPSSSEVRSPLRPRPK